MGPRPSSTGSGASLREERFLHHIGQDNSFSKVGIVGLHSFELSSHNMFSHLLCPESTPRALTSTQHEVLTSLKYPPAASRPQALWPHSIAPP